MTEKEIIESWAKTARPLLTICLIGFTQKNTEKKIILQQSCQSWIAC